MFVTGCFITPLCC